VSSELDARAATAKRLAEEASGLYKVSWTDATGHHTLEIPIIGTGTG
jgi:hypothetical protein